MTARIQSFREFWPYYLGEHRRPGTRALHLIGTTLSLLFLLSAVTTARWWLFFVAVVCGYAFAWVGHFFVEHNRPATFRYPLWSLAADFKMWFAAVTGRLGESCSGPTAPDRRQPTVTAGFARVRPSPS